MIQCGLVGALKYFNYINTFLAPSSCPTTHFIEYNNKVERESVQKEARRGRENPIT